MNANAIIRFPGKRMLSPREVAEITGWSYDEACRTCRLYGVKPGKRSLYIHPDVLDVALKRPWELKKEPETKPKRR